MSAADPVRDSSPHWNGVPFQWGDESRLNGKISGFRDKLADFTNRE